MCHDRLPGVSPGQFDIELKQRLVRDDEAVLEVVLRQFGPAAAASLRRRYYVLNQHDSEDVLASALFRLWAYRKRLDLESGSLAVLFYRIAENTVRSLFKKGWHKVRRQEVSLEDATEVLVCLEVRGTQADPKEDCELQGDLRAIVDRLPATYRYIVLADANAKDRVASAEQISRELEIPIKTVRVYRSRAMATIRRELELMGYRVPEARK